MIFSIRKKLTILLLLGLLGLAALGYHLYKESPARSALPHLQDYAYLHAIGDLRSGLKEVESSELAYAFSGDRTYVIAFGDASAALLGTVKQLKTLSHGSINRLRRFETIETLIKQRVQFAEKIVAAYSRGGKKPAIALVQTNAGRILSGDIIQALDGLEQDALRASAYQDRVAENSIRKGASLIATGYGSVVVILVLSIVLIGREISRSRRMNRELQDMRERTRLYGEGLKDMALVMLSAEGIFTSWNADAQRLLGFSESEMIGRHFSLCFSEEDVRLGKPALCLQAADTEGSLEQVCSRQRKDGGIFHAHNLVTALRDPAGSLRGYAVLMRDVTEQKRAEDLLNKLSLSVEQAGDLVLIADRNGKVEYANKAVEEVTGYTKDELIAGGLGLLGIGKQNAGQERALWETVLAGRPYQAEMTATRKNDELIYLDQMVTPIRDPGGNVTHLVFTGSDLTPVKQMREKLDFLTSYDTLTGLPNRDLFYERLNRDLSGEPARKTLAVLAIDIDRFKYLNEIYGIEAASNVLKQVAESLSVSVNKGDTVARLGSDEFGIVLHDVAKPADVVLFVKMIMKNVPQIVMSGGREISVTLAIGIAVAPADGSEALTLMKNADTALAKAKGLGRNRYQFYTSGMNEEISELVFMERRLFDALKNKEYMLAYQPYYHLITRKVAGAEALLRWNNDEFGLVSPAKFIPMLEETGMITDVGSWVLRTACCQIKEWSNGKSHLPVSVNLSPSQFRHEYLAESIENTVHELGIDPHRLVLEVTESTFMKDQEYAITMLRRLRSIGVSISIDDFGTGYSSLSYLKKFPVDMIKIDQSFVKDVATDPDTTSLVTAIISMAHSLNLKTIAEGVENEDQWKVLRLLKCDMGQGYYFSLAVPAKEFELLVG